MFQNCVILDSNETFALFINTFLKFQNCVILDSNETSQKTQGVSQEFQNCVILDSNGINQKGAIRVLVVILNCSDLLCNQNNY